MTEVFFSFPSMLYGWPTLGAIGKKKQTTLTTIIAAAFQTAGLAVLALTHSFDLIHIAVVRGVTEALLFALRFSFYWKYRGEFAAGPTVEAAADQT